MTASSSHPTIDPSLAEAMAEAGLNPGRSPSPVRLPHTATLFARRAERLRHLAPGHSLEAWLSFLALVADAQQAVIADGIAGPATPAERWRDDLRALLGRLDGRVPENARPAFAALSARMDDTAAVEGIARRLMDGSAGPDDLAPAPFVVAALQVAWTRHAAGLEPASVTPTATAFGCPVCGSPPAAGVIQTGMESGGLRYLHCGLCHTAWHHVRTACIACGEGHQLTYHSLTPAAGDAKDHPDTGARAEACGGCHAYLKLFLGEKAPGLDPLADDLATLALDLLVGEEGFRRINVNPLLTLAG